MRMLGVLLTSVLLFTGLARAAPADEAAARSVAYPGAKFSEDLSKLFVNGVQFGRGRALAFVTADSFDKVVQFYKARPNAQVTVGEEDLGYSILRYQAAFRGADLQKLNALAKANLGKKSKRAFPARIDISEFRFGLVVERPYLSPKVELVDGTLIVIVVSSK